MKKRDWDRVQGSGAEDRIGFYRLEPMDPQPGTQDLHTPVLVIGGGVAGLTAAFELSRAGIGSLVADKGLFAGGHAAGLACKATDRCLKCNDCLVEDLLRSVAEHRPFDLRLQTRATKIGRAEQGFRAWLASTHPVIDPGRCTGCGHCLTACPEDAAGVIRRSPSFHVAPFYAVDPAPWNELDEVVRDRVRATCPEGAIRSLPPESLWAWEGEGIVLATGFEPFDPAEKKAYEFARFPNMITTLELDRMLRDTGRIRRVSDGEPARKVAFVQCVGSRDPSLGHEFCSRICCGVALRMGLRLVHDDPDADVTVCYMDIQNFGKDFDRYWSEANTKLRLTRGLPGDLYQADDGRIYMSRYDERENRTLTEGFDMVILSVGMMPAAGNPHFADDLGPAADADGFLTLPGGEDGGGLILAGSVRGPMDVAESIAAGKAAAWRMGNYLKKFE